MPGWVAGATIIGGIIAGSASNSAASRNQASFREQLDYTIWSDDQNATVTANQANFENDLTLSSLLDGRGDKRADRDFRYLGSLLNYAAPGQPLQRPEEPVYGAAPEAPNHQVNKYPGYDPKRGERRF